jgi:phosphatidylglycerol---prolipoprotein diacylglyceryl transferase
MLPFHFKLGWLAVTPNEVFAVLGAVICGFVARRRLKSLGSTEGGVLDYVLAALAGGSVGARLYYWLPLWIRGQMSFSQLFTSWSDGSGFYGAFIGGALALAVTAHFKKMPILKTLDATMGTVPLGFGIGKIGCFLAGCCYGMRSPSGLSFQPGSLCYVTQRSAGQLPHGAATSLPVHPVQLYDMIYGFALFALLVLLQRRSARPGEVYAASAVGYSAYRFFIEFLRDDPDRHTFGASALTDSQITAIAVFVVAAGCWAWLRLRKPAENGPSTPN